MKAARAAVVSMCVVITFELIAFLCMIIFGVSKRVLITFGLVIIAYVIIASLLVFFNKDQRIKESPQQINFWAFEPIDREGDVDDFLNELLSFLTSDQRKTFLPKYNQRFRIWWESEYIGDSHVTGIVTKMTHVSKDEILIETASEKYLGMVKDNYDLAIMNDLIQEQN